MKPRKGKKLNRKYKREFWIHQDPEAMETLQKGLRDAAEGRVTRVKDLKNFL
jgi:hypothetical protein